MRTTMGSGLLAALLLGLSATLPAQDVVDLGKGMTLLPGGQVAGGQKSANAVLIEAPQGLIVFDAGRGGAQTERILERIEAAQAGAPILVNSHWHLDHAGGLAAIRKAHPSALLFANDAAIRNVGAPIFAAYREQLVAGLKNPDEPVPEDAAARAELSLIAGSISFYPTNNVPRSRDAELAGRNVHLGLGSAVSGGDVWLREDDAGVLLAGDLVSLPAPNFETACAEIWIDDLNVLWAQKFDRLVPGHGRVIDKDEFRVWQMAFEDLVKCAGSRKSDESCRDGWIKDTRKLLGAEEQAEASRMLDRDIPTLLRNEEAQAKACAGR